MNVSSVAGVLAGGASRRFGSPKALLELPGGCTMLEHVVTVAASVAPEVVLLGRPPVVPRALASVPILPDARPDCGPMGGLGALLEHAAPRWGLLLSCDLPALRAPVLQRLLRAAADKPEADAVAFVTGADPGVYEACCALYHPRLRPVVAETLETGATGLQELLRRLRTTALVPSEPEVRALLDVDTAQDLDALGELTD